MRARLNTPYQDTVGTKRVPPSVQLYSGALLAAKQSLPQPYVYKKQEQGFIVYSVGQNLEDDGGISNREKGFKGDYDIVWEVRN